MSRNEVFFASVLTFTARIPSFSSSNSLLGSLLAFAACVLNEREPLVLTLNLDSCQVEKPVPADDF